MPRKILLADDSVTAQNMGRRILSEAGYEVVTVGNGSAALKKLVELKPDLVILDVYMPGYGGIEVCQRVKESAETSNIPVLLTVGKLEPFKPEEARRARADAHLVKPFEATELLAALTKLEDRMVPQSAPAPGSKPAKSKVFQTLRNSKDREFGDTDTGWKQRLTIPPPASRRAEPEPEKPEAEEPATANTAFRDFARPEMQESVDVSPSADFPPGYLPQDITAEEIAAITAAAAAFDDKPALLEPELSTEATVEETAEEGSVASAPASPESAQEQINEADPSASFSSANADFAGLAESGKSHNEAEAEVASASSQSSPEEFAAPELSQSELGQSELGNDLEVAAALESLAPANGIDAFAGYIPDEQMEEDKARVLGGAFAEEESIWRSALRGPRWMAEEIAVPESEAALILEQEMQKVYAAVAELSSQSIGSMESRAEANSGAGSAMDAYAAPANAAGSGQNDAGLSDSANQLEQASPSSAEEFHAAAIAGSENIESSAVAEASEFAKEPPAAEPEPIQAVGSVLPETSEPDEAASAEEPAPTEAAASQKKSVYAVAAAANAEFHSINHTVASEAASPEQSEPGPAEAESAVAPVELRDHAHEAQLADAWAHWRQIRESIASPQFTQQVADVAVAGYKEIHPQEQAASQSPADSFSADNAPPAASSDPSAIASIVDSVLAELKPRLVEEIARKLGKENK